MLAASEISVIKTKISDEFDDYIGMYDFDKYPAAPYQNFKQSFSTVKIEPQFVHNAMVWKWGHWGKSNFPERHKMLIADIEKHWPEFASSSACRKPRETYEFWQQALGTGKRFITCAFLSHLTHAETVPLIDQHNYRAMHGFLSLVRPTHTWKRRPSNWTDIETLSAFVCQMTEVLGRSESEIDKFLMMYGRKWKTHIDNKRPKRR